MTSVKRAKQQHALQTYGSHLSHNGIVHHSPKDSVVRDKNVACNERESRLHEILETLRRGGDCRGQGPLTVCDALTGHVGVVEEGGGEGGVIGFVDADFVVGGGVV